MHWFFNNRREVNKKPKRQDVRDGDQSFENPLYGRVSSSQHAVNTDEGRDHLPEPITYDTEHNDEFDANNVFERHDNSIETMMEEEEPPYINL
jgi:hypothetical protein